MAIVLISAAEDIDAWRRAMASLLPGVDLRQWPDIGAVKEITMAITWRAPEGALQALPGLRLIFSLGRGTDHLFRFDDLPRGISIVRLVDDSMRRQMTAYVVAAVLRHLCHMADYAGCQGRREWHALAVHDPAATTVGVLGLGTLGRDAVEKLAGFGFKVCGWSKTPKSIPGIQCFAGMSSLAAMLGKCDIICCLLALTPKTRGLFNTTTFAAMKPGAYLINAARGGHVVETDLSAALDSGRLAGATLDVFDEEPLPADHPLWNHPKVTITPHIAAVTMIDSATEQVAENYRRMKAGTPLLNPIDPSRGY